MKTMETIKIKNTNDYANLFSKKCACTCRANSSKELSELCERLIPAVSEHCADLEDLDSCFDQSFALYAYLAVSKKNASAMDAFFLEYEDRFYEYECLDGEEYETYDRETGQLLDTVGFTFFVDDLFFLHELIGKIADKLVELGENCDLILSHIFPEGEGMILDAEGNELSRGEDAALTWKLIDGEFRSPNCRMVIYGDEIEALLRYGYYFFEGFSVEDWKHYFGVEIEVGFKTEEGARAFHSEAPKTGAKLALMYRMGAFPDLFGSKEEVLDLLDCYPNLIEVLDKKWIQDRDIVLAYVNANLRFIKRYLDLRYAYFKDGVDTAREFLLLKRNANIRQQVDFWFDSHPYDEEIIGLLLKGRMWECVHYTSETYDEKKMIKVLDRCPASIRAVFEYWYDTYCQNSKAYISAKERYQTDDDENCFYLALRKCMEVISSLKNQDDAYRILFLNAFFADFDARYTFYDSKIAECFDLLDAKTRHDLASEYYYASRYLKAAEFDTALVAEIVKECPIAAHLLPDEYVLKNKLKVSACDIKKQCGECMKCKMWHMYPSL